MESWKRLYLLLLLLGMGLSIVRGDVYAVIISGGRNKLFNHERYWNDCAFLYRTLRHDYHIPQQRITLLMADGDHPADDMLKAEATRFASSPTDLDGDGQPDLYLSCTRQHLDEAFNRLAQQLTADDHLFVFITDHGEIDAQSRTHLWLWGNDHLSPQALAACAMVNRSCVSFLFMRGLPAAYRYFFVSVLVRAMGVMYIFLFRRPDRAYSAAPVLGFPPRGRR